MPSACTQVPPVTLRTSTSSRAPRGLNSSKSQPLWPPPNHQRDVTPAAVGLVQKFGLVERALAGHIPQGRSKHIFVDDECRTVHNFKIVNGCDDRVVQIGGNLASASRQRRITGSAVISRSNFFSATVRPSRVSRARYTTPIPPWPSFSSM